MVREEAGLGDYMDDIGQHDVCRNGGVGLESTGPSKVSYVLK
jgi:hypothetical protein